jgi:hypothetical protein
MVSIPMRLARALSLGMTAAVACAALFVRTRGDRAETTESPAIRPPVRSVSLEHPADQWRDSGFVEMVGPVRPPTSEDAELRIVVYLQLPAGAAIATRAVDGGDDALLLYPPGTVADRVEYVGRGPIDDAPRADWLVADVRGTSLGASREEFHVYRPTSTRPDARLVGVAWPRDDDEAQIEATRALGELLERGVALAPSSAAAREAAARHLRAINGCAGCHTRGRAPRARAEEPGLVNRGTDASGFFQISTVLYDHAPLETYRARNANAGDPFVHFVCGPTRTGAIVAGDPLGRVRCPSGEIPVGVLDVRAALTAGDVHARRLCESRRWLFGHLDDPGRAQFGEAAAECGL